MATARKTSVSPNNRKPVSLRDRLAKKRAKIVTEYFALDEDGEAAIKKVEDAQKLLDISTAIKARQANADIDLGALTKVRDDAAAERNKTCLALQFRGLSEDALDALMSAYVGEDIPEDATDEKKKALEQANYEKTKEWTSHAMAETVVDSDLTADDWRDELASGRWTKGDIVRIRDAIMTAYGAQPADGIPKG